jgi:predicted Zn-dependent protease
MKKLILVGLPFIVVGCVASLAMAEEKLPLLKVGSDTYSNVTVFKVSASDIYFTSDKGIANVKLRNLDPDLQKHFHYNPGTAAEVQQKQAAANAQYRAAIAKEEHATRPTPATSDQGVDVYLVPLDDFGLDVTASIAASLSKELGIRIQPTRNVTIEGLAPFPGTTQFSGDDIAGAVKQASLKLPGNLTNTACVVLTQRDINQNDRTTRFNFATHYSKSRISVLSSARLVGPKDGKLANEETVRARIAKMVKRSIGLVYFGYPLSADVQDLMYSPIMSLNDVDRIGYDFLNPNADSQRASP